MKWRTKKQDDPRVTVRSSFAKDFIGMFLTLLAINGGYMLIFMTVFGIVPTVNNLLNFELISYMVFFSALLAFVTTRLRDSIMGAPMRKIGDAAKRVAEGDFSVYLDSERTDGKMSYVDVMYEDFNTMIEELSSTETMKNDFIANVSHELKTPISVIQNYASALQSDALTHKQRKEYAQTISDASARLSLLVTNILKLNKLENQEILPEPTPINLSEQLRMCALNHEDLWENNNISFEADIEDGIIVSAEDSMLELVWNNLITNAIKFTGDGGKVSVALKKEEGLAVVMIEDTGCGMEEHVMRHIFDKFYQGDPSHSQMGNGLGLSMVRRVIELLHGEIRVQSRTGKGSTFTIVLPIDE